MTLLQLIPVILSVLVLGAHFYRAGEMFLVAAVAAAGALLLVRRPWAARALQLTLLLGAAEWLRTMTALVAERQEVGLPYTRMMVILCGVALWTGASALLFSTRRLSRRYGLPQVGATRERAFGSVNTRRGEGRPLTSQRRSIRASQAAEVSSSRDLEALTKIHCLLENRFII